MTAQRLVLLVWLLDPFSGAFASEVGSQFVGRWEVTTNYPGGSFVAGLDLAADGQRITGRSGYLVPDGFFYKYSGTLEKETLHLTVLAPDGATPIGELFLAAKEDSLSGKGVLHEVPIMVSGRRPLQRPDKASKVIEFTPDVYYRTFSGSHPPALHIFPGDIVRTHTVDANGGDDKGQRTLPGNPQTGPFYIEGAMIGDTIAVHLNKIQPNRDTAFQQRAVLAPQVLPSGYPQQPTETWSSSWKLNRKRNKATPVDPSDKLKGLTVDLIPMLGCIAVAPYWDQTFLTTDLGPFGGNLDYNQIREGATVYLPVYQAGALLTIGDGHAFQSDGEITGQGLETSMDVEFSVALIRNHLLDQPWIENDEYVMVSGIGNSLTDAQQIATAGLANWLASRYRLSSSEIATVLAVSVRYDIAEVVDPHAHVVAKISKRSLNQVPRPEPPTSVFCQASWGCLLD